MKIEPAGESAYRAEAQAPSGGEATAIFSSPFDERDLKIFLLEIGSPRRIGNRGRIQEPAGKTAVDFGEKLFSAVFKGDVLKVFDSARREANRKNYGLRLRLRLIGAPELADLPWEYLYDSPDFLALSTDTPLVRYNDQPSPPRLLAVSLPLRILVTVSSPHDLPKLDVSREQANIREALAVLIQEGKLELEFSPDAGLQTLEGSLRQARFRKRSFHAWHFIGHGHFDPASQAGQLALCDAGGRLSLANGFQLGTLFRDYPEIRLVLLNACEGARNSRQDPFAGVAASLVECGIPAVIGMQFEISDEAAIVFSKGFYTALVDGLPVDAALTGARRSIFFMPNWLEWATPVLFMRSPDGILFKIQRRPARERAEQERLAKEQAEGERLAREQAEAERRAVERAEQERLAKEQADAERQAREKAEAERQAKLSQIYQQGLQSWQAQDWTSAVDHFRALLAEDPNYPDASTKLVEAEQQVNLALERQARLTELQRWYNAGVEAAARQGWQAATDAYRRVISLDPQHRDAAGLLARAEAELKKAAEERARPVQAETARKRAKAQPEIQVGAEIGHSKPKKKAEPGFPKISAQNFRNLTCIRILAGHTGGVTGVAFSPDGTLLASGSRDKTVRLWRVSDGMEVRTLKGHTNEVTGVAFSPDGTLLVSGSDDKTVRLWRTSDGTKIRTLKGHTYNVSGVAFSPDGMRLASGSYDKTVRLWRVDGSEVRILKGHSDGVNGVAFSPDGKLLASASYDQTVMLWQVSNGTEVRTLKVHTHWVEGVAFSPDGTLLASASDDKTVRLWRVSDGMEFRTPKMHTGRVLAVAFSPDGTLLASSTWNLTVSIWRVLEGTKGRILKGHTGYGVWGVAFSPGGTLLASCSADKTVRLWGVPGEGS